MKPQTCCAMLVSVLSAFGVAQASEIFEIEPNHPINFAHTVVVPNGSVTVAAVLGNVTGPLVDDLDFYAFYAEEGDVVTLDIDGGEGGARNVDTTMVVFADSPGYPKLRENDDALEIDGSFSTDSRIDDFRVPATGYYIVGVSNWPRHFVDGGTVKDPEMVDNGDYSLVISGVSNPILQINIDIKPGSGERAPVNPKSRGKIPVALLSSSEFNATIADKTSLTFGATGDERSLSHCGDVKDVNGDGHLDLVCHFMNQAAGFKPGDLEGIVRGRAGDGRAFEGRGLLKVVPQKRW